MKTTQNYPTSTYDVTNVSNINFKVYMKNGDSFVTDFFTREDALTMKSIMKNDKNVESFEARISDGKFLTDIRL